MSGTKRESMRLMAERWNDFPESHRSALEERILNGPPRSLFRDDLDESEFERHRDWEVFIRLSRIRHARGALTEGAITALEEIQAHYPAWQAGPGDRDDFPSWHSSRSGLQGDSSALDGVPVTMLLARAEELARGFDNRDVWRIYVSKEPERCFEALELEAKKGHWPKKEFWTGFFLEAFPIGGDQPLNQSLFKRLFELFLSSADSVQEEWSLLLTHKFARHQAQWTDASEAEKLQIWDRLWELALKRAGEDDEQSHADDPVNRAIGEPGGELSELLVQMLGDRRRKGDGGIPAGLRTRFDSVVQASGRQAGLARIMLGFYCQFLYMADPKWTTENIVPLFEWRHPEALAIQQAYHFRGQVGPADFFGLIKPYVLAAFERRDWPHGSRDNLSHHLVLAIMSKYRSDEPWDISAAEAKKALRVSEPHVRHAAAWFLWRQLKDTAKEKRATTWHEIIKPTFLDLWPPDRECQDGQTSYRLAEMALSAEAAFPDTWASIEPYLVPMTGDDHGLILYQLYKENSAELQRFPAECLRLVAALVDEDSRIYPDMLRKVLNEIVDADSTLASESAFRRLDAFARRHGY